MINLFYNLSNIIMKKIIKNFSCFVIVVMLFVQNFSFLPYLNLWKIVEAAYNQNFTNSLKSNSGTFTWTSELTTYTWNYVSWNNLNLNFNFDFTGTNYTGINYDVMYFDPIWNSSWSKKSFVQWICYSWGIVWNFTNFGTNTWFTAISTLNNSNNSMWSFQSWNLYISWMHDWYYDLKVSTSWNALDYINYKFAVDNTPPEFANVCSSTNIMPNDATISWVIIKDITLSGVYLQYGTWWLYNNSYLVPILSWTEYSNYWQSWFVWNIYLTGLLASTNYNWRIYAIDKLWNFSYKTWANFTTTDSLWWAWNWYAFQTPITFNFANWW